MLSPHVHSVFLHSWFNDLFLIPCALPPILLLHRQLGLRSHDRPPTAGEIFGHWLGWSVLFEWVGPHFIHRATGDPWDVVAYAAGAMLAFVGWRCVYQGVFRPVA